MTCESVVFCLSFCQRQECSAENVGKRTHVTTRSHVITRVMTPEPVAFYLAFCHKQECSAENVGYVRKTDLRNNPSRNSFTCHHPLITQVTIGLYRLSCLVRKSGYFQNPDCPETECFPSRIADF